MLPLIAVGKEPTHKSLKYDSIKILKMQAFFTEKLIYLENTSSVTFLNLAVMSLGRVTAEPITTA